MWSRKRFGFPPSPKALLASFLSDSLGEFMDVDPSSIESNLLSNTKIVLKDLRLKQRTLREIDIPSYKSECSPNVDKIVVDGCISKLEFSWKWGGDDNTPFVRDVILTVQGVALRVYPVTTTEHKVKNSGNLAEPSQPTKSNEKGKGYLQNAMDQVLDHLTLHILDFEVIFEAIQPEASLSIQCKEVRVITYEKNEKDKSLSQRLSFENLAASIVSPEISERIPLLDPVCYSALVTRRSGRRFLDGIYTGLEIQGGRIPGHDSDEVTLHLDQEIILRVGNRLMEMWMLPTTHTPTKSDATPNNECDIFRDALDQQASSLIILPLPSLMITLPHFATLHMPQGVFSYRMDNSLCELRGTSGILINENIPLITMHSNHEWKIDMIASTIFLHKDKESDENIPKSSVTKNANLIASIIWNEAAMNKFIASVSRLIEWMSAKLVSEVEGAVVRTLEARVISPWSFGAKGTVLLGVQGMNGESLQCSLKFPYFSVNSSAVLTELRLETLVLGPNVSFGKVGLVMQGIQLVDGVICSTYPIKIEIGSFSILKEIQIFLERLLDSFLRNKGRQDDLKRTKSQNCPNANISVSLVADMQLTINEPHAVLSLEGMVISTKLVTCKKISGYSQSGINCCLSSLTLSISDCPSLTVETIEELRVAPLCFVLNRPIYGLTVIFREVITIQSREIYATVLSNPINSGKSQTSLTMNFSPMIIPSIQFSVEVAHITNLNQGFENNTISLSQVHVNTKLNFPNENQTSSFRQCLIDIELVVGSLNSSILEATSIRTCACIPMELTEIKKFQMNVGDVSVLAKFNELDWLCVLGVDAENKGGLKIPSIAMPHAYIAAINLNMKCEGKVFGSSNSIFIKDFTGDHLTKSHDILEHFKKTIVSKLPSFVLNTEIMGQTLADKAAMGVGVLAISSAPLASVSSVVVVDTIRGAVAAGKELRGAAVSEGYKFGDFTRGAFRSLQKASEKGANLRRGDSTHYQIGDFTAGVTSASNEYVGENKARLGSAVASGVGMMVGLAVAGPVGLLAGSYAGASMGRQAFEGDNAQTVSYGTNQNGERQGMTDVAVQNQSQSVEARIPDSQQHQADIHNNSFRNTGMLPTEGRTQHKQKQEQKKGYRFGDFTRSLLSGPKT